MNPLRSFAALQARVYQFLEEQDERTLRAISDGTARLTVVHGDNTPAVPARADARTPSPRGTAAPGTPLHAPSSALQHLSGLTSADERRTYLNTAGFTVKKLREAAKLRGLTGYSRLTREELVDLLVRHISEQAASTTSSHPTDDSEPVAHDAPPPPPTPSTGAPPPDVDAAAIALRLRETDTVEQGDAYLDSLHLARGGLLAVAAELQLTRVDRLSQKELKRRVLQQAIGARRKFAGLRKW
ncbi:hypothetical protein ABT324_05480 [Saccharopolyspora sp. NPDC000359]|uniref:hypothetical protein n=1 Tax=Saccharopolyspora sp. NPDC000359 TaxID=3154251 RepID=UPI003332EAA5